MTVSPETLYDLLETTWPPATKNRVGAFTIRYGAGGGKRVCAATVEERIDAGALRMAEDAMAGLEQDALFMIREGDAELDALLETSGYRIIDPVNIYISPTAPLAGADMPRVATFTIWEPLQIMRDIWGEGGIGPDRVAVMARATCVKTGLFGRHDNRPSATGYVGVQSDIAMVHALEVLSRDRRQGMGRYMMQRAARWAQNQGASKLAVICTAANESANALYTSMGFQLVGHYHYRIKG